MTTVQPPGGKENGFPPIKKTEQIFQNITFALSIILSLGCILTGVFGIYKIAFFGAIGAHVSQGLAFGGSGLLGVAVILFAIRQCINHKTSITIQVSETPSEVPPLSIPPRLPTQAPPPNDPAPVRAHAYPGAPLPVPPPPAPLPAPDPLMRADPLLAAAPAASLPQPPLADSLPTSWQELVKLQDARAGTTLYTPATQFTLLDVVRAKLPLPTEIKGPPRPARDNFEAKMRDLYRGLLHGEVKLVINFVEETFKREGPASLYTVPQAREFVRAQLVAFNALIAQPIDIDQFFGAFAEEENSLMPQALLESHIGTFLSNLTRDIEFLFKAEDDGQGVELRHLVEIDRYIDAEVSKFNEQMGGWMHDQDASALAFRSIDSGTLHGVLVPLKRLLELWKRMEALVTFPGGIDQKIQLLSQLATDLPNSDDPLWAEYPRMKGLMIRALSGMGTGFFSNHRFIVTDQDDQERKVCVESGVAAIARKLLVTAPDVEVVMDTSGDAEDAARLQRQLNAGNQDPNQALIAAILAGQI